MTKGTNSLGKAELAVDCKNPLGEGPFHDAQTQSLWWISIPLTSCIQRMDLASGDVRTWQVPEMVSYAVPTEGGELLVASHGGLGKFDTDSGELKRIRQLEPMLPFNRSNDACCDTNGNLWVGTMQNNLAPDRSEIKVMGDTGSVYRVSKDLEIERKVSDIAITNSICFAPDGKRMYLADSPKNVIWSYDIDTDSGELGERAEFARFDRGVPDGSTVDADGCVWNARYGGSCVVRFTPDGKADGIVDVPASQVTSCTFGGADCATLYITTARNGLDEGELSSEPHAGGLFMARTGAAGTPEVRFAG